MGTAYHPKPATALGCPHRARRCYLIQHEGSKPYPVRGGLLAPLALNDPILKRFDTLSPLTKKLSKRVLINFERIEYDLTVNNTIMAAYVSDVSKCVERSRMGRINDLKGCNTIKQLAGR
ncbi:MAG: hypothetical protein U1G05_00085 [Kiritimatiellia bacterium]